MAAECEKTVRDKTCAITAIGRCATCGDAYCTAHAGRRSAIFNATQILLNQCASCVEAAAAQREAEMAKQEADVLIALKKTPAIAFRETFLNWTSATARNAAVDILCSMDPDDFTGVALKELAKVDRLRTFPITVSWEEEIRPAGLFRGKQSVRHEEKLEIWRIFNKIALSTTGVWVIESDFDGGRYHWIRWGSIQSETLAREIREKRAQVGYGPHTWVKNFLG
jgi:hypothetical protein